jgi:hypothetical protein
MSLLALETLWRGFPLSSVLLHFWQEISSEVADILSAVYWQEAKLRSA